MAEVQETVAVTDATTHMFHAMVDILTWAGQPSRVVYTAYVLHRGFNPVRMTVPVALAREIGLPLPSDEG